MESRREKEEQELLSAYIETIRSAGQELIGWAENSARRQRLEVQGTLHRYRILFGIFFLSTVSFGAVIVYLLESKIVRPLSIVERATRSVAEGRFEQIEWNSGRDEISSLVRAFNRMVVQLEENREQMVRTEKLTALGTLTSGVAHELNNPLGNISTSCQILLEEVDQGFLPHHKQLLLSIEDQVMKARDIVRALLEFSRQREFELRPVELKEVVDDTLKLMRGDIPARVEVRSEIPPGIVLNLDKARIQQALINLVMNGIQAIEDSGKVVIRAQERPERGSVWVEVEDTGCGIPPEVLPRVFDPFFTTKEVGRGTGLGLSVTYGIVERHGGRI
jgi:signal transduction histidine kinase